MIEESTIKQVHDRADIVDVVNKYNITLTRRGVNLFGCCPFHNERTPSFVVNPARNTYHCFGCGAHGDAIRFVMELENKTYPEAIEHIANMFGIPVLHTAKQLTDEQIQAQKKRESLQIAVQRVQEWFVEQFNADIPGAAQARKYAYDRWGKEYCAEYGIGFAPDSWNALLEYCQRNCIDEHLLQELGILRLSEKSKKLYSFFRDRITIPITDRYGNVIAFTARYIGKDPDQSKYINSTDSPLFKKGDVVFGLHEAYRAASKAGRFIIVEGAPDVLRLQSGEVGLTETVASLGTTWSETQFKQLQRYAPSLVFLPDADPPKKKEELFGPGIKAVMKNGLLALQLGFNVSVREIPVGKKPIVVPLFDFEIEDAEAEALKLKIAEAKKNGMPKKQRDRLTLTQTERDAIPHKKVISETYFKQDPDSFITSGTVFNSIEDVHFVVWYGLKLLRSAGTDTEKVQAVNEICRDALLYITDDTLLNRLLDTLAKEFGKLKLWRDALSRANGEQQRAKEQKAKESMSAEQAALYKLGIEVKGGCYCSYEKDGLERWSNFTLTPILHAIDGETSLRLFNIKNERGTIREIELTPDDLVSLTSFQKRIESLGFFIFKGDYAKLQNLKEFLYSTSETALKISKMGWNPTEEIYAFGDGIFADNVLYPVDELGIVRIGDKSYYLPAFSKIHIDKQDSYQLERSFSCREHGEISLYDYLDRMITVFGDNAKVGFAFILATLFLDVVKRSSKRLALLNIFGRKGTGKTELGTALMSFFIKLNDPPSLATTSMASLNDLLSYGENNLVHLDEYKNELDFRKIELLKQIWGGSGQTKKDMEGNKKVKRTYVRSGVILTGQDAPIRDDALFSRVIHLSYSNSTFSAEAKRNFDEFQTISARGVSHLTVQLLKFRKLFETDYATHYAVCKRELIAALTDDNVEDRVLNNWLAPLAAFHTVQISLELPFSYTDLFNICVGGIRRQNEQLKKNSDVAVFWSMLDSAHMQGRIIAKAHFLLKRKSFFKQNSGNIIDFERDKTLLYLNHKTVFDVLGQRVNGSNVVGKLDTVSLESYLRTHAAFLGTKQERFWVLNSNGSPNYSYETRSDGKQIRKVEDVRPMAFVFDYELLQESYELNLETEVRGENELSEDDLEQKPQPPADEPKPAPTLFSEPEREDDDLPF